MNLRQPATSPGTRRVGRLVRLLVAGLLLASAPVSLGADATPPGMRSESAIEGDLQAAQASQSQIAAQVADRQAEVKALTARQQALEGDIARTASALDTINTDLTAVRGQIVRIVADIEEVQRQYDALVSELASLDAQVVDLVAREEAKGLELRDRQDQLADSMRAANAADGRSLLEVVLSSDTFSEALSDVAWHLDVGRRDQELAERIERDRLTLVTLRETIQSARDETNVVRQETAVQGRRLEQERGRLADAEATLEALEAATARELAAEKAAFEELARNRSDLEAAIAEAQAEQAALAREIDALVEEEARRAAEQLRLAAEARRRAEEERRIADAAAARRAEEQARLAGIPSEYSGRLSWPLIGRVTGEWGCSGYPGYGPGGPGCEHYHNGIDIARACGSPVAAAADGTVAYVGWNWADGPDPAWMVVIAHATDLTTWYAHLQPEAPPGIQPGARVSAGQVIGHEGNTGRSTGCHLHWMVELGGQFVNGRRFL